MTLAAYIRLGSFLLHKPFELNCIKITSRSRGTRAITEERVLFINEHAATCTQIWSRSVFTCTRTVSSGHETLLIISYCVRHVKCCRFFLEKKLVTWLFTFLGRQRWYFFNLSRTEVPRTLYFALCFLRNTCGLVCFYFTPFSRAESKNSSTESSIN